MGLLDEARIAYWEGHFRGTDVPDTSWRMENGRVARAQTRHENGNESVPIIITNNTINVF